MVHTQANNFFAVLRTVWDNRQTPLVSPDWDLLAALAKAHNVTALFYTGASRYEEFSQWSEEHRRALQQETVAQVVAQAMRTQCFLELYQVLLQAGVRPLVMKGIICRSLYGSLADYRPSGDEDIYLPPEQIELCRQVLEQQGWRLASYQEGMTVHDDLQHFSYESDQALRHLELHPALFAGKTPGLQRCRDYVQNVASRAVTVSVEGMQLYTLDYTDHYLFLFLHLVKHFTGTGVGIRQVLDLMQFQRAWGQKIDWAEVRRAIPLLSSPGLYADVVELGRRLGFEEADPLFDAVAPDLLLEDSLEGGIFGFDRKGHGQGVAVTEAAKYATLPGRLRRLFFPSVEEMQAMRPWLRRRPWLLPLAWLQRAGRLFKGSAQYQRVSFTSLAEAWKRVNVLRRYGLLPARGEDAH